MTDDLFGNASKWGRGEDHPAGPKVFHKVHDYHHLDPSIVATYDEDTNVMTIYMPVFATLSIEQQNAVYRRTETVFAE